MIGDQGRVGVAPCGHLGEHVVGNYVRCSAGCDTVEPSDDFAVEEPTLDFAIDLMSGNGTCPGCGSADVEPFDVFFGPPMMHCIRCGHVWSKP